MNLILNVLSPKGYSAGPAKHIFTTAGGTLGRKSDCTWMLSDAYISGHHARIEWRDGAFWLTDLNSTNGTYLNDGESPLPGGVPQKLSDGDRIFIGDLEIYVAYSEEDVAGVADLGPLSQGFDEPRMGSSSARSVATGAWLDSAGSDLPAKQAESPAAPEPPHGPAAAPMDIPDDWFVQDLGGFEQEPGSSSGKESLGDIPGLDELAELEQGKAKEPAPEPSQPAPPPESLMGPPEPEQEDLGGQQALPPDLEMPEQPAAAASEVPPPEPQPGPVAPVEPPSPQPTPQPAPQPAPPASTGTPGPAGDELVQAFLAGAGLKASDVPPERMAEVAQLAGQTLRLSVSGMSELIRMRSTFKEEFRTGDQTTMRPLDNNPLKVGFELDEILRRGVVQPDPAFMPLPDAMAESFDDLKAHQMAILAGMQGALKEVLELLKPELIEAQAQKRSRLFANKHTVMWEQFQERYEQLTGDQSTSFREVFGKPFVRTYNAAAEHYKRNRQANKNPPRR